jgi:hypothetical protein
MMLLDRSQHCAQINKRKLMQIPDFVTDYFKKQIREKGSLVVDVDVFDKTDKFLYRHGLTFASDYHFHGGSGYTLHINEYLHRLLTFTQKPIKIYVNRMPLDKIEPVALPPPELPVAIDLSQTENNNE